MPIHLQILAFGFLSPLLMGAGAAAVSVPIIIHLLNKRRFRVVIWAAMEWLLAAQRRNARRLRFQRWLLLAIRCLALLIISAGIAQLVLQSTAIANLFTRQRVVAVVWDDSYSMGYQHQGAGASGVSAFEHSRHLLLDLLDHLHPGDKALVVRASRGASLTPANHPSPDIAAIRAQVAAAKLTDAATDLPAALDQAAAALKEIETSAQTRQLIVLTDFSNSSIHDPLRGSGAANRVQGLEGDRLKKAAQDAKSHATDFRIIDLGTPDQINTAITDLHPRRPAIVAGVPAAFEVTVLNATQQAQLDIPVTLFIDNVAVHADKINKIEPGASHTLEVEATIPTVGRHVVEARLPADGLPVDDTRRLMADVRREIPVLLVDGSPGDGGRTSYGSTAYLWAAYHSSEVQASSIFAPKVITELELATTPLGTYGEVVLSDTGDLGPAVRDSLRKYVESGGLLMVFPGNRTNTQRLNETLGEKGAQLLPATLGQLMKMQSDAPDAPQGNATGGIPFATESFTHPVVAVFAAAYKEGKQVGFTTVRTTQYIKLGVPADGSVETVLRYAQPDGTPGDPAIVLKDVGKGRVVLFAGSADATWNNWGAEPSFLPFMHELTYYAMARESADSNLTLRVGEKINLPADAASPGAWSAPHDSQISVTAEVDSQGRARLLSETLTAAGPYGPAAGDIRPVVVVNPDAEEADIRHVTSAAMSAATGVDPTSIVVQPASLDSPGSALASDNKGWTMGASLVAAALALFFLETILAMVFSMYR